MFNYERSECYNFVNILLEDFDMDYLQFINSQCQLIQISHFLKAILKKILVIIELVGYRPSKEIKTHKYYFPQIFWTD